MSDSDSDSDFEEFDKNGLYIVIDKRERAIIPHFKILQPKTNIPFFVEHITTGDIAICYRGYILIIIERKTWSDLAASIKDGRKSNIEKLKLLREKTDCQVAYLLEGNPCPKPTQKFARIPHKNLRAHLDHLSFRDGVHMLYAKSCFNTAQRVFELAKNYSTIKPSPLEEIDDLLKNPKGGDEKQETELKTKHTSSDELILFNMWCSFSYITDKTANLFIEKGHKIKDFVLGKIPKKDIAMMKYQSGTLIGLKRAKNILEKAQLEKSHIKMLSEIPSITSKTAQKIFEITSLEEILENLESDDYIETLANIQKTEKTKIGKASAKKIIKFLSM